MKVKLLKKLRKKSRKYCRIVRTKNSYYLQCLRHFTDTNGWDNHEYVDIQESKNLDYLKRLCEVHRRNYIHSCIGKVIY